MMKLQRLGVFNEMSPVVSGMESCKSLTEINQYSASAGPDLYQP